MSFRPSSLPSALRQNLDKQINSFHIQITFPIKVLMENHTCSPAVHGKSHSHTASENLLVLLLEGKLQTKISTVVEWHTENSFHNSRLTYSTFVKWNHSMSYHNSTHTYLYCCEMNSYYFIPQLIVVWLNFHFYYGNAISVQRRSVVLNFPIRHSRHMTPGRT